MNNLKISNSLTRSKDLFKPINLKNITMYVCGPTVYADPHVGNGRSLIVFDLLYRVLIKLYGQKNITYVRNITDVDDKIIEVSKTKGIPIDKITSDVILLIGMLFDFEVSIILSSTSVIFLT